MRRITVFIATIAVFGALAAPTGAATTKTINWTYGSNVSLSIKKGDSVKWTWKSGPHNVAGSSSSGGTKVSGSYTRKFTSKGTFSFYCAPHRSIMKATVRVS
jgi:plastocyanin